MNMKPWRLTINGKTWDPYVPPATPPQIVIRGVLAPSESPEDSHVAALLWSLTQHLPLATAVRQLAGFLGIDRDMIHVSFDMLENRIDPWQGYDGETCYHRPRPCVCAVTVKYSLSRRRFCVSTCHVYDVTTAVF